MAGTTVWVWVSKGAMPDAIGKEGLHGAIVCEQNRDCTRPELCLTEVMMAQRGKRQYKIQKLES